MSWLCEDFLTFFSPITEFPIATGCFDRIAESLCINIALTYLRLNNVHTVNRFFGFIAEFLIFAKNNDHVFVCQVQVGT